MVASDAHVFPGFLTEVLTKISYQSHQLLFSHASAEVSGKNVPERNIASTRSRTHNHPVISLTRGRGQKLKVKINKKAKTQKQGVAELCFLSTALLQNVFYRFMKFKVDSFNSWK